MKKKITLWGENPSNQTIMPMLGLTNDQDSYAEINERRRSVSDYYTMMIGLMGIFYTLPTLQLVMNYQSRYKETGLITLHYKKFIHIC